MILKRLFLYYSLGCYFFCSFSMENNIVTMSPVDIEVERICGLIEQNHLNKYQEYWPMFRSFYLHCDAISLNKNQVAGEISIIEYYILEGIDKDAVLQELTKKHWYVALLMKILADKTIAKINGIRGSKIDTRCDQIMHAMCHDSATVTEGMIYNRVIEHFYNELDGIENSFLDSIPQELRGIYFIVLKGIDQVQSSSLSLSACNTYLRVTDDNKIDTIWDTTSGKVITDVIDLHNVKYWKKVNWIPAEREKDFWGYDCDGEKYSIATKNCHATIKNLPILDMMQQSSSHIGCETKVITLFKRPELSLYFCQKAFENSKNSLAELIALRDSKHFADIKSFSQENLKQCVIKRINELTATTTK